MGEKIKILVRSAICGGAVVLVPEYGLYVDEVYVS